MTTVFTIVYNGERIVTPPVPLTMTREEIKSQCVSRWPELANAVMNVSDDNVITFVLPTANKQ